MKKLLVLILPIALLSNCQPGKTEQDVSETGEELPPPTLVKPVVTTSGSFAEKFKTIVAAYMSVKDAFVKSDTAAVNRAAETLAQAVTQTEADGPAQEKWSRFKPMLARTVESVRGVAKLTDKRAAFEDLSKIMYDAVTAFGAADTVYKQYCPMAFNDKGAYWLSLNAEIRNPYFGDEMLECGEVQQVLTFEE